MHIIYRLCDAAGKNRPEWFSKEKCLRNFLDVFAAPAVYQSNGVHHHLHFVLDGACLQTITNLEQALVRCRVPLPWISTYYINERHNARFDVKQANEKPRTQNGASLLMKNALPRRQEFPIVTL
ncbi:hypothetical protein LCGC14_1414980 [marine sediment metagenome]|uniref:Uncharacterized protein n=1 Tax=marine sediment metagenome TaxID=412755 RepID=A0A0F9M8K6_9ZZZZ